MDYRGIEYRSYIYDTLYGNNPGKLGLASFDVAMGRLPVFHPEWYDATDRLRRSPPTASSGAPRGTWPSPATTTATAQPTWPSSDPPAATGTSLSAAAVIMYGAAVGMPGDIPPATSTATVTPTWPSTAADNNWYIRTAVARCSCPAGSGDSAGDKPEAGDYDGDGMTDLAVFRPSNGKWYIRTVGWSRAPARLRSGA